MLFIINIWRRGWTLPILGVGLWALVAIVAGAIYPQFVQRVQVTPNEPEKERPYIERNIEATQAAMGLGSVDVEEVPFDLETNKDNIDLTANEASIKNIRIWDPSPAVLGKTFPQLQRVRDYYRINDVDVDRYELNGTPTQVVLSVRDLNTANVPRDTWAAKHLTYTHGYGMIVAPANAKEASGEPHFVAKDVPYVSEVDELQLTQPAVYFGEGLSRYVVTGSKQQELSFQEDEGTQYAPYEGSDGVRLDNPLKRAAFALRFGDVNPLISDQLTGESKILYIRDIKERVSALAPFLHYDADPYPVISDGRIKWIVDAYTTTNRYPYGETAETGVLADGSGLDHDFNYVRNSVKAVVDAYDGTVDFYVMPVDDPIIEAYRDAFPDLFTDFEEMPDDLKDHLRYPEDLFRVQTTMWSRYHVEDPGSFYEGNDYWDVARDPGTAGAGEGTSVTNAAGRHGRHPRRAHRPLLPVHRAPRRRRAGVHPDAALRADVPGRRQPAAHRVHGGEERSRRLRAAAGVRDAAREPARRARHRPGQHPERRRRVGAGDAPVRQRIHRLLREPHGHPDRRRPRLRAAVLRDLRRDRDPGARVRHRVLRGRGVHPADPRGGAGGDLRRVAAHVGGAANGRAR